MYEEIANAEALEAVAQAEASAPTPVPEVTVPMVDGKCAWCNRQMKVLEDTVYSYCEEKCKEMHRARL